MNRRQVSYLVMFCATISLLAGCTKDNPVDPTVSKLAALYDRLPAITGCDEGLLKEAEKLLVLDRINYFRAMHNVSSVTYKHTDDAYVQKAAEICAANNLLTHTPATSLTCYSTVGDTGCGTSNLWGGTVFAPNIASIVVTPSASTVDSWLEDKDVESLGHRRWMLNPFLRTIAFGRVDLQTDSTTIATFAALKVFDEPLGFAPITSSVTGIGFPQGDFPKASFDKSWYLSFSYLLDAGYYWNNMDVKFSAATVEMVDGSGSPVAITSVKYDNNAYGLPNNIQWKATGLLDGVTYTVRIKNMMNKTAPLPTYEYTFTFR